MVNKIINIKFANKTFLFKDFAKDHIVNCLRSGHFYEEGMLQFIQSLNLKGIAIDIGSYIGTHAIFFSLACQFDYVYAFEPRPQSYYLLLEHIVLNNIINIVPYPFAVGDKSKECGLQIGPLSNLGVTKVVDGKGTKMVRLDDFIKDDNISLIKIDVEGMEKEVINGAFHIIKLCHPHLFVEIEEKDCKEGIDKILEPLGYEAIREFNWTPTYYYKFVY